MSEIIWYLSFYDWLISLILVQPLWKAVLEITQKIKNGTALWPRNSTFGNLLKLKTLIWKNISTPMFTAALRTIAKLWKQPKCPSIGEWIKQILGIYTMEYFCCKKEENFTLCDSMDGPGVQRTLKSTIRKQTIRLKNGPKTLDTSQKKIYNC